MLKSLSSLLKNRKEVWYFYDLFLLSLVVALFKSSLFPVLLAGLAGAVLLAKLYLDHSKDLALNQASNDKLVIKMDDITSRLNKVEMENGLRKNRTY